MRMIVNLWLYLEEFVVFKLKKMHLSLIAYNSQTISENLIIDRSYNWEFHSLWGVFEFSFVTKNFPKKISQK
jgi:hypothetical protein